MQLVMSHSVMLKAANRPGVVWTLALLPRWEVARDMRLLLPELLEATMLMQATMR